MRVYVFSVVTCLFLCVPGSIRGQVAATGKWLHDFAAAEKLSQETGRTLVVHFHASWCGPCKVMERNVLSTSAVLRAIGDDLVAVKVDSDFRKDLVRRFGIRILPTDVFVSSDGKVLATKVGYSGQSSYLANLSRHRVRPTAKPDTMVADKSIGSTKTITTRQRINEAPKPAIQQVSVQPSKLTMTLQQTSKKRIGLGGYCPVSLASASEWKSGETEFKFEYHGVCYLLHSQEQLRRFKAEPEKFVPALHGLDPVAFKNTNKLESGAIELGARYRDKVFFFSSQTNRDVFLQNPKQYAQTASATSLKSVVASGIEL